MANRIYFVDVAIPADRKGEGEIRCMRYLMGVGFSGLGG
jgi:hypothetical protein